MKEHQDFISTVESFKQVFNCGILLTPQGVDLGWLQGAVESFHNYPRCFHVKWKAGKISACSRFDNARVKKTLAANDCRPFFKHCHGGVLELVVPLHAGEHFAGMMFIGPFHCPKPEALPTGTLLSEFACRDLTEIRAQFPLPELSAAAAINLRNLAVLLANALKDIMDAQLKSAGVPETRKAMIQRFINSRYRDSDCSLAHLANFMGLGVSRTRQLVKAEFGRPLAEAINEKRMDYAMNLLVRSSFTASRIARQAGFRYPSYFFRAFNKYVGTSPGDFRRKNAGTKQNPSRN